MSPPTSESAIDPESWLDEHGDWLFQYALNRVQDRHVAEDLVQETLVDAVRGWARFRGESTVRTWLTAILRRRIADFFQVTSRRRKLWKRQVEEADSDGPAFAANHAALYAPGLSNDAFQSRLERDEFRSIVEDCLNRLPSHLRQAFVARLNDERASLDSVGKTIGINANNLGVRLYRARLLLRDCVERIWDK